ncbi:hypothetical protein BH24CHL1_BH24CHL1_17970 [soil metagenome]
MENPFSWDYLTAPLSETHFGPLSLAFAVFFTLVFVGSIVAYIMAAKRKEINPLLRNAIHSGSQILMWITAAGLFFYAFRLMRVPFLNLYMRIWIYLAFLLLVLAVVYFVYYLRKVYPIKLAAYQKRRERRRYTAPAQSAARSRGRKTRPRRTAAKSR